MEQYISKSAVVAEINRLLAFYSKEIEDNKEDPWAMDIAKRDILQEVLSFIDTLDMNPDDKVEPKFKIGDIIRFKGSETLEEEVEPHEIVSYYNELYVFADGTTDLFREQDLYELVDQKPSDKVEPKFNAGDWVVISTSDGEKVVQIDSIEYFKSGELRYITSEGRWFGNGTEAHLWNIQDAKDGDVLYSECLRILWIFKGRGTVYCGCNLNCNDGAFCGEGYIETPTDVIPAPKEQRDFLFEKMKESGYEWDAENKELKKIEQKSQRMISAEAKEAMYDKPAWSEKDEQHIDSLLKRLDGLCRNEFERTRFAISEDRDWLTSLKERIE